MDAQIGELHVSVPFAQMAPVMTKERFCDLTGVPIGVLEGWIQREYIPSVTFGKRTLVNCVKLCQILLESDV
ncbi:MAG: hypothetical protein H7833_08520 [Magnetococcus sp. DMHC-1]